MCTNPNNSSTSDASAEKSSADKVIVVAMSKKHPITIAGRQYIADIYVSEQDLARICKIDAASSPQECRILLADIIREKLQCSEAERPASQIISSQTDEFFAEFIALFLEEDEELKSLYNQQQEEPDICKRFCISYHKSWNQRMAHLSERLTEILRPVLEQSQQMKGIITETVNSLLEKQQAFLQSLASLKDYYSRLFAQLPKIKIPQLSEEERELRKRAVCKWGTFGWTFPPWESLNFFDNPPGTLDAADKQMLPYGKTAVMETLWAETKKEFKCKKSDYNSAIILFKEKQYTACSLLLFSLIDGVLIRFQTNAKQKKQVGNGAIQFFHIKVRKRPNFEHTFFMYFNFFNVFSCLNEMYKVDEDFKGTPKIVNRNYVAHGMSKRNVRKRDCVKLFYLYYNLLLLV